MFALSLVAHEGRRNSYHFKFTGPTAEISGYFLKEQLASVDRAHPRLTVSRMSDDDYVQIVAKSLMTHGRPYEPEVAARFALCLTYAEAAQAATKLRSTAFPLHINSIGEDFAIGTNESLFLLPYIKFSRTRDSVIRTAMNFPTPPYASGRSWSDEFKVPPMLDQTTLAQLRQLTSNWVKESVKLLADHFAKKQGA